ncbi:carbohydrate kinase family protein [Streptomyces sp. A1136]|uniref:carbohydrate kinase family protein n=1 Tax=Streptomyces sp. A1136 TaxID=2563102 RepID=UPI00109E4B7E|nr:carbohydrate kinase family protein [Streptomyces sp. A1136]THA54583.1 carbohydrate kinase family protein [Streptomyces sp. A1136]
MRIALSGSIATDHLMVFPGRFSDQLVADRLDHVSLSFLADSLDIRRGGVAANIAYGLGLLGLAPVLIGAVGPDFAEYAVRLKEHGVDTDAVHVSADHHTARFVCTTDADHNQIATFYAGAMAEARNIALEPIAQRVGGLDLVLVSPNDPQAMLNHTSEARRLGIPFAADPSQQLARLDRDQVRTLVDGARWLFTNAYESALLQERTGWTEAQVLDRTGLWVSTLGEAGSHIRRTGAATLHVPAVPSPAAVDPTGVGDAFRAGFLAATARGLDPEQAARLGSALATTALECVGTQEYGLDRGALLSRLAATYGPAAAQGIETALPGPR